MKTWALVNLAVKFVVTPLHHPGGVPARPSDPSTRGSACERLDHTRSELWNDSPPQLSPNLDR
jgi:hypothetical protein